MSFKLDTIFIEEGCRTSAVCERVLARIPSSVAVRYVADGRETVRPAAEIPDPFGAGKRRLTIMRRRGPFVMACPATSTRFACCGYLVLVLASNCPMDCSYCFLQEYLADNPGFQVYANYTNAIEELERLRHNAPQRSLRVGTGELADSLAFDRLTAMTRDLVEYFAEHDNLLLELKTKTDETDNLLAVDPKGRTLVSWTLSPWRVFKSSERHTAAPSARIAAAKRILDAGYKVGFHFDPIIAYPGAERDYGELVDELLDVVEPGAISFVSLGGLRMTPSLRAAARRRFPNDPMLCGEEVLSPDGRYRTFTPLRLKLYRILTDRLAKTGGRIPVYLCMESSSANEQIFGTKAASRSALAERLANI
jgi:DNA repair photolyase